jgi:predicted PurR-regulated permease PerM
MDTAVGHWFRGQLLVAAIVGALYAVGLAVVFGIFGIDFKLGIAIGIAAGMTNVIPYFGMILAIVLTTLVVLLNFPGWVGVLFVVGVFLVNHILEAYVVAPRVLGSSVDLNPIAVIILLLAGGELAGIWGILLIIPIAGAIKVIIPDLRAIYHETASYRGGDVAVETDDQGEADVEEAENAEKADKSRKPPPDSTELPPGDLNPHGV